MAIFKCKMCGGELEISDGQTVSKCPYCGTTQTVPSSNEAKKLSYFNKANGLRLNKEFSKASYFYEMITSEFPKESEAYWGLVLCKFGIEYIDDPKTNRKVMTCHHMIYKSIFDDGDYKKAILYADVVAKDVYEQEAQEIDQLQKKIYDSEFNEKFDIFICYKETDESGERTEDSVLAQEIYKLLVDEGYKVFFSKITLEGKIGNEYEPIIYSALNSAKVLIHVTTSIEYTNSIWVKNEWERFAKKLNKNKTIIPCYKGINPNALPHEMKYFQGLDLSKIGVYQDLIHGIEKYFNKKETSESRMAQNLEESLLPIYQDRISDLLQIDQFCSFSRDIVPIINFFEENLDYLESSKYLIEAKYQYAKHIETFSDCLQAEEYLQEISPYKDSEDLIEYIRKKKIDLRQKDLVNEGYIVGIPKSVDVSCLSELIKLLIDSVKKSNKNKDVLSNDDLQLIKANNDKILNYLLNNGKNIIQESIDINGLEKLEGNIRRLEKNNLGNQNISLLSSFIETRINEINEQIKLEISKKRKRKIKIISIVAVAVLAVVGTITGFVVSSKVNHSANKISFNVTSKRSEYKADVSPYINGCYYVYFTYEISSGSNVGIDYMQFVTYVKKGGKDIGSIKSSVENMNLSPKSTKTYSLYLQDNQPEINNNTFFITLYNCELSELTFSYDVLCINFSDGKYYFGHNYNKIFN